jgi:hypothetical protein
MGIPVKTVKDVSGVVGVSRWALSEDNTTLNIVIDKSWLGLARGERFERVRMEILELPTTITSVVMWFGPGDCWGAPSVGQTLARWEEGAELGGVMPIDDGEPRESQSQSDDGSQIDSSPTKQPKRPRSPDSSPEPKKSRTDTSGPSQTA